MSNSHSSDEEDSIEIRKHPASPRLSADIVEIEKKRDYFLKIHNEFGKEM